MARSDRDKPIDTVGEGLKDPNVAEAVIAYLDLAYLEKVAEAVALGAIGAIADTQVSERREADADAAHAKAFARHQSTNGRSIESEDRKSIDAENRFIDLIGKAVSNAMCDTLLSWMC